MNAGDRFLQRWRISKVRPYLKAGHSVLDIGCAADGALFRQISGLGRCVGIDPDLPGDYSVGSARMLKGLFPDALGGDGTPFDAITMLAVLEHVPADAQPKLAADCARYLKPGGHLLITVPAPAVDHLTALLRALRIIHGMSLEEHTGFDVRRTPEIFCAGGLSFVRRRRFQLGLNNLFVFRK
jgi:SAM-dependent methyltransferase